MAMQNLTNIYDQLAAGKNQNTVINDVRNGKTTYAHSISVLTILCLEMFNNIYLSMDIEESNTLIYIQLK